MMMGPRRGVALLLGLLLSLLSAEAAQAVCNINSAGMSMSPGTASTGTYTFPNAPVAQAIAVTISGTYTTNASGGTCTLALSFQRSSYPPATMASVSGGAATLPYTIRSTASGGNTLLFTGSSVSLSNVLQYSFASAGGNRTNVPFTASLTIYVLMQPNSPQAAGSYSDTLTAWVFNIASGNSVYSRTFTVTGTVAKACRIGGVSSGPIDTATIPVTATGSVNTAAISRSYANIMCNTPSNLQLTSQNGGVRTTAIAPSGFTNIIDYTSAATFSGATATLDTSTNPLASGPEAGTAVPTTGTTPSGSISVSITPRANTARLLSGSYADVLTITVTPQ
mgnify:CR=1 FL=1